MKFGLCLYVLTYVGAWFNALTLVILAWIGVFSRWLGHAVVGEGVEKVGNEFEPKMGEEAAATPGLCVVETVEK